MTVVDKIHDTGSRDKVMEDTRLAVCLLALARKCFHLQVISHYEGWGRDEQTGENSPSACSANKCHIKCGQWDEIWTHGLSLQWWRTSVLQIYPTAILVAGGAAFRGELIIH